jgi:WD40 repeat protein
MGKKLFCLTFSQPDGRLLAGSEDYNDQPRVFIWDVNEGSLLLNRDVPRMHGSDGLRPSMAFSPDGKLLATAHRDHTARLWEIPSGNLKAPLKEHTLRGHTASVMAVAFSPDGKTLATGSYDGKVKLWNIATQQEVATLELLPRSCISLRFSPDGRTLAARNRRAGSQAEKRDQAAITNAALCPLPSALLSAKWPTFALDKNMNMGILYGTRP